MRAKIFSHPRSGTGLLMETVAKNFYPDDDLRTPSGVFGHWAGRVPVPGHPYGKLGGGHGFYSDGIGSQCLYIYRDGRDVALSVWRTHALMNPSWAGISLSDFLRRPLDWRGSPGTRSKDKITIAEHWSSHVWSWISSAKKALCVSYESLTSDPVRELDRISLLLRIPHAGIIIESLAGRFPNSGTAGAWRDFFSDDDNVFFKAKSGAVLELISRAT